MNRDTLFKDNPEAEEVENLIKYTDKSIFLTGRAGTGKSTLLNHIVSNLEKKFIILAPTGIAALQVGGQTIHSFFGFDTRPYLPKDNDLPIFHNRMDLIKGLDLIVIDEISMVRADIMNAIDLTLKRYLKNNLPFGGKQLFLIGDLFQLPPVIGYNEEVVKIIRENYETEYFFSADVFKDSELKVIELQKVYRQTELDFIDILDKIRTNTAEKSDIDKLNAKLLNHKGFDLNGAIVLTITNEKVDDINMKYLHKIRRPEYRFVALRTGTFLKNESFFKLPTNKVLKLKEGAQVMFIRNDSEGKWSNGTIGKVRKIKNEKIWVDINGMVYPVEKEVWGDVRYKWNKKEKK